MYDNHKSYLHHLNSLFHGSLVLPLGYRMIVGREKALMGHITISLDYGVKVGILSDKVDLLHEMPIRSPIPKASQCLQPVRRPNSVPSSQNVHQNTPTANHLLHPLHYLQRPCPLGTLQLDHHSPFHPSTLPFRQSTQTPAHGCRAPVRKSRKCSLAQ